MKRGRPPRVVERLARDDVHARSTPVPRPKLAIDEGDLAGALAGGELFLHYQPIVDVRSGACRRVEALLRWRHPRLGVILPGAFLHLATSPTLVKAIGQWVIAAALAQRLQWRGQGVRLGVSVNLSHHELMHVDAVAAAIRGIESGALTVEVRSGDADDADVRVAAIRLAAMGADIALDDVGQQDPPSRALAAVIDEIKLARALVRRATVEPSARAGLQALVELARDYRISVVAVGVEDRRTYDLVAGLGCDMAQGYWVSRPLVPDRLRPARRWVAGLAFTGVVAFGTHVAAGKVAASGGRAIELPLTQRGLLSSGCCLDLPSLGDASRPTPASKLDQVQTRTGLPFSSQATARAEIFVESSLGAQFAATLASKVDRDVAELEEQFGRKFDDRPSLYIFATRTNFATGLQQVFGVPGPEAGVLAVANGGVALTRHGAIIINLQNVNARDLTIIRHELTHALVHQIIGVGGSIPTWVDEGIATLQEHRGISDELAAARSAATALSVIAAGDTILEDLVPASQWLQRNASLGGKAYTVSAEAVRLLEQRVSREGLVRMLDRVGRGDSFGAAFAAESGESFGDFERAFPARLAEDQGSARILQVRNDDSVRWSIAGFTPNKPVAITIEGDRYKVQFEVVADQLGMYEAVFGATAPKGEYALRASSSAGAHASATVRT